MRQARESLLEPKTEFARLLRDLAEAAMAVTHHDIGSDEPEFIHEVDSMEVRFRRIVRAFLTKRQKRERSRK